MQDPHDGHDPFGDDDDDDKPKGRTLQERADAAAAGEEGEQQSLFEGGVIDADQDVTFNSLIPPGSKVGYNVKMTSHGVPMRGEGLIKPDREVRLEVLCFASNYSEKPKGEDRGDGTRNIEEWKVDITLKPHHIRLLGDTFAATKKCFETAIMTNGQEAGALLDELNAMYTEYLGSGIVTNDVLA